MGMTTTKIAVSLPTSLVVKAKQAVRRGRAASVSAYVAAAMAEKNQAETLAEMLDEMLVETGGPMTGRERREVEALLGPRPKHRRRTA